MSMTQVQYIVKINTDLAASSFRKLTDKFPLILEVILKMFVWACNLKKIQVVIV